MKHLLLLRGINVSGQKLIKMDALRKSLASAGFADVQTYIQSGNIILESDLNEAELTQKVQSAIKTDFGFDVPIVATNSKLISEIISKVPFDEKDKVYVAFFDKEPGRKNAATWSAAEYGNDVTVFGRRALYVKYDESAGKSKLTNALIERKLGVISTMRNWNTTVKLSEMLNN